MGPWQATDSLACFRPTPVLDSRCFQTRYRERGEGETRLTDFATP